MKAFTSKLRENSDSGSLWAICQHYGRVLENNSSLLFGLLVRPESDLKTPKITVKRALSTLILIEGSKDAVLTLASVYRYIEDFVEDDIYNYLLPYLKTIKEIVDKIPEYNEHIGEVFKNKKFLQKYHKAEKLIKQRKDTLIDELNFLLQLAEREDLIITREDLMINKEQGQ